MSKKERARATTSTAPRQTAFAGSDVEGSNISGFNVDELERIAIARYKELRSLGEIVIQASRRAEAYARLDAALARHVYNGA